MTNIIAISGKIGSGKDTIGDIIRYLTAEAKVDMVNQNLSVTIEDLIKGSFKEHSDWEIRKMAGKLKDVACLILGCTREQLEDRDFKEQPLGSEWDRFYVAEKIHGVEVKRFSGIFLTENEAYFHHDLKPFLLAETYKEKLTPRLFLQLLGTDAGRNIIHPNIWVNAFWSDYNPENNSKWIITDCRFPNEAQSVKDRGGIIIRTERDNPNQSDHPSETGLDDYQEFDYIIDNNGSIEELVGEVAEILINEKIL